jgi:hypothetical protein
VKVGAADGARRQTHNGIERVLDAGIVHLVQPDVPNVMEYDCFHAASSGFASPARQGRERAAEERLQDLGIIL